MRFQGQVAIISGGLGDIGRAIAREFLLQGASVSLGDLMEAAQVSDELENLRSLGGRVMFTKVDVTSENEVEQWIQQTSRELGTPTLIIPNAGIVIRKSIFEIPAEDWKKQMDVNLNGALYLARGCAKRLVDEGQKGKIVFTGSWAAHRPAPGIAAYCASKAALRMVCRTMALELAEYGILVNEVAPGIVNAGLSKENIEKNAAEGPAFVGKIPTAEWIEADEVALQVANLCDPRNRNTTGNVVVMDGGLSHTSKWV